MSNQELTDYQLAEERFSRIMFKGNPPDQIKDLMLRSFRAGWIDSALTIKTKLITDSQMELGKLFLESAIMLQMEVENGNKSPV